ncbi:response regulator [Krasilnikovia sp. MM14-A1259]|uniref:response regulator n=1 Tax=Krasilnikovia sp. MM14-A1259 TaxID=3373539 RepID=UPI0038096D47
MAVIVAADDEPAVRELISRILEGAGHTVITVHDGGAAIVRVRELRPDLILLDGLMPPGMSGFDAFAVLHDDDELSAIPVMIVTGSVTPDEVRRQLPDVCDVVTKPFTPDELLHCVRRMLGLPGPST